ncbi:MAG: hypothetical protein RIQ53_792, partial [Pseudomonadota bacterium]
MRADPAHELAPQPGPPAPVVPAAQGPATHAGSLTVSVVQRGGRPMSGVSARFPLDGGSIGRADHNRLVLVDMERTISRVHARLFPTDGHWMLHNQGSNSVRINGRLLTAGRELRLRDGDTLQIGPYLLRARIDALPGTRPPHARGGDDAPTTVKVDHRGQAQTLPGSPAPTPMATDTGDETVIRPIPGTAALPAAGGRPPVAASREAVPLANGGTGLPAAAPPAAAASADAPRGTATGTTPTTPPAPTSSATPGTTPGTTPGAAAQAVAMAAALDRATLAPPTADSGAIVSRAPAATAAPAAAAPPPAPPAAPAAVGRLAAFRRLAQFALAPSAREALDSTQALPTELPTASRLDAEAAAVRSATGGNPRAGSLRVGTSTSALGGPMSGAVIAPRPSAHRDGRPPAAAAPSTAAAAPSPLTPPPAARIPAATAADAGPAGTTGPGTPAAPRGTERPSTTDASPPPDATPAAEPAFAHTAPTDDTDNAPVATPPTAIQTTRGVGTGTAAPDAPEDAPALGWFPGRQDETGLELAAQALDEALGAALQAVWRITGAPPTDGGEQALALARETFARTLEARAAGLRPPADIDA